MNPSSVPRSRPSAIWGPFVVAVCILMLTSLTVDDARAQQLDIRGAGCIGPCYSVGCCGKQIVVNENGVGLGRNFDCHRFLESAPADQRSAFCAVAQDQGATCVCEVEYRNACNDLRTQMQEAGQAPIE